MGDTINVDWSALGPPPDFVGDYVNAFRVGQNLKRQSAVQNANAPTGAPPAADQPLAAHIAAMSPAERAGAGRRADLLAAVGLGLKSVPYTERPTVLAYMTPALAAHGVPPAAIAGFDPTDEALDAAVASARSLEGMLGPPAD